jgi:hypothetical protein
MLESPAGFLAPLLGQPSFDRKIPATFLILIGKANLLTQLDLTVLIVN